MVIVKSEGRLQDDDLSTFVTAKSTMKPQGEEEYGTGCHANLLPSGRGRCREENEKVFVVMQS